MKFLSLLVSFVFICVYSQNHIKYLELETLVYSFYTDGYLSCLDAGKNYNIEINDKKVQEYFKDYDVDVYVSQSILNISLKTRGILSKEKSYSFYMVKNNE